MKFTWSDSTPVVSDKMLTHFQNSKSITVSRMKFTWSGSHPVVSDNVFTHFLNSKLINLSKMKVTWSDSTPVVSDCSSMSRLQSMLVAVKQSPRSTMSTFNTCNILGHKFWPELGSFCWILTRAVSPTFRLKGPILHLFLMEALIM